MYNKPVWHWFNICLDLFLLNLQTSYFSPLSDLISNAAYPAQTPRRIAGPTSRLYKPWSFLVASCYFTFSSNFISNPVYYPTREIGPMLVQYWYTVCYAGPTLKQHWLAGYDTHRPVYFSASIVHSLTVGLMLGQQPRHCPSLLIRLNYSS